MNFCENCNIACTDDRCHKCGRKKLRVVQDDDFCLVAKVNKLSGDIFKSYLESENIDCVFMPYGTGVNSKFALPLESYLLYVRYKNIDYVKQLLKNMNY
ncbi:MAG: hypothetical protein NC350_05795 [Corallococcus sp.]|nr:hypothetical protein [Corallococcus sp.]